MRGKWLASSNLDGTEWHVIPLNDLIAHTYTDCVCIPLIPDDEEHDPGYVHFYVHSSLDGRELTE